MPRLIEGNPVLDAYTRSRSGLASVHAADAARREADQRRENATVERIQAENLDRRLGAEFAQPQPQPAPAAAPAPTPANPAIPIPASVTQPAAITPPPAPPAAQQGSGLRNLSVGERTANVMMQTPGFRHSGVQLMQQEEQQRTEAEAAHTTRFLDLAQQNPQMAYAYAIENQLPVPVGYLEALAQTGLDKTLLAEDKRLRAAYGIGTARPDSAGYLQALEQLQRSLMEQMRQFVAQGQAQQTATAASVDPAAAQPAPALPSFSSAGVDFPTPRPYERPTYIYTPEGTYRAFSDRVEEVKAPGGQAIIQPRGQSGRVSVFQQKYAMYLQANPGDTQGALDYASGRKQVLPQQEEKWAHAMAVAEARGNFTLQRDPTFITRRSQEILAGWRQSNAATTPAQNYTDPETGTTGTFTGQYENGSPIYQTPDGRRFVVE